MRDTPDPERGWALASLTGELTFDAAKPAFIRKAVEARMDGALFALSYDYVGDLAETVALVWPAKPGANREPELSEVVDALRGASRARGAETARTLARRARCRRPLGAAEASDRRTCASASPRGSPSRRSRRWAALRCREIEEVWHGQKRALSGSVRLAGEAQREADSRHAGPLPARHAGAGYRRGKGFRQLRRGRLCRGMEMGRHPRPGRQRARPEEALQPHRRRDRSGLSGCASTF